MTFTTHHACVGVSGLRGDDGVLVAGRWVGPLGDAAILSRRDLAGATLRVDCQYGWDVAADVDGRQRAGRRRVPAQRRLVEALHRA